jgi:hypothetical protein
MKKQMIPGLALAAIALLASCSNDETVEAPTGKEIQFTSAFVDNNTRATFDPSSTTDNLKEFQVYGWVSKGTVADQVFNGTTVEYKTYPTGGSSWVSSETKYWLNGGSYTFSAIAGNNGDLTINGTNERVAEPQVTGFQSDGKTDLIYSEQTATGLESGNEAVAFTFKHQLAKVRISFYNETNQYTTPLEAKITDIKMTNPIESGDVKLSSTAHGAVWSNQKQGTTALLFGDSETSDDSQYITRRSQGGTEVTPCTIENLVIPAGSDVSYTVTFKATIYLDGMEYKTVTPTATISGVEFKPGYAYNFTIRMMNDSLSGSLETIKFTASVEDWGNYVDDDQWTYFVPIEASTTSSSGSGDLLPAL